MTMIKRTYSCSMPGVWRALAHNKGALVVYHSPRACGHVTHEMDLAIHYRSMARRQFIPGQYTAPLVVSGIEQEHSIFGGAEQLLQCIDYAVARYKPLYVVIASSCVAGVIGDDVAAVARQAEETWKLPVMSIPCHGFLDGDYYTGFYHAGKVLMDRFMSSQVRQDNRVTLLGDRGGPHAADIKEMKDLLSALGFTLQNVFPSCASLEEIRQIPAAALTVPVAGTAQSYRWISRLGTELQDRFGIPFFDYDHPVGLTGTQVWLKKIGAFLQKEEEALRLSRQQEERLHGHALPYRRKTQDMKAVLCIGRPLRYFHPAWVFELIAEAGLSLEGIVWLDGLTGQEYDAMRQEIEIYTNVPFFQQGEDGKILEETELVLTTHELADGAKRQFFLPLLPPAGVSGVLLLLNKLAQLAGRPERRGGVLYG